MAYPHSAPAGCRIPAERDDRRTVPGRRPRHFFRVATVVFPIMPAGFVHGGSRLAVKLAGRDPLDPHQAAPTLGRPGHAHLVVVFVVPLVGNDDISNKTQYAKRRRKKSRLKEKRNGITCDRTGRR